MAHRKESYWLRIGSLPWQEATLEQFIEAGFDPKSESEFGPLGIKEFCGSGISGRVTSAEIINENYQKEMLMHLENVKNLCRENGGSWKGFRLGDEDVLLVRVRRKSRKPFFLRVISVSGEVNDYGYIRVDDPKHEGMIARRYNDQSFVLDYQRGEPRPA